MAELPAGQIVVTCRSNGGVPASYIVAEGDPTTAAEIIQSRMMFEEKVTDVYPVPAWQLEAFGLTPGEFIPWRPWA
jgi:hypothetical protein